MDDAAGFSSTSSSSVTSLETRPRSSSDDAQDVSVSMAWTTGTLWHFLGFDEGFRTTALLSMGRFAMALRMRCWSLADSDSKP